MNMTTLSKKAAAFTATLSGAALAAALLAPAGAAAAELELSFYTGFQEAASSTASGRRANGTPFSGTIGWEGRSFEMPPYYGGRAIWWQPSNIGWGIEATHTKVYSPAGDMPAGFTRLEFTDGHNIVTANVMKRWPGHWAQGKLTPYVGAGLGLAIPHVDVTENGNRTFGYQVTGPAVRVMGGVKYSLNDNWALFGELQVVWSDNEADLAGGGTLKSQVTTGAVNFGVSYSF